MRVICRFQTIFINSFWYFSFIKNYLYEKLQVTLYAFIKNKLATVFYTNTLYVYAIHILKNIRVIENLLILQDMVTTEKYLLATFHCGYVSR